MSSLRWMLLLFGIAAGILALAQAALAWDGAYYLLLLVDREAPMVPFHRYSVVLLQAPAYLAHVLGLGLPVVRAMFSVTHAAVAAGAIALSAWMVRGKREGLLIWAVLGIGVATVPGQLFLVSEALQATQLAWPLALWVAAGMPRSRAPAAAGIAVALPFFHPVAVTLLAAIGLIAVAMGLRSYFVREDRPSGRLYLRAPAPKGQDRIPERTRYMVLVGLGLLTLALARYLPFPLKLDPQYLDIGRFRPHYYEAVLGLPLTALILSWVGALAMASAGTGRLWQWLRGFGAACVISASLVLVVWASRPVSWVHSLDFRTWVALLSLPLFAVAGLEAVIRHGPIEFDRFRAFVATAVAAGFVVVIGVQSHTWVGLLDRLEGEIAAAPGACLAADREVPWIADTALAHWGLGSLAVLSQGRSPRTLVVQEAKECAMPGFDELVPIAPWDHRPREGGWFDFRRAGRGGSLPVTVEKAALGL